VLEPVVEAGTYQGNERVPPRPVHCRVCTIFIGEGYQETQPIPLPNGKGYVCWRCFESLKRQAEKRVTSDKRPEGAAR